MSHWDDIDSECKAVEEYLYGQKIEDEEEFYLNFDKPLTEVIK